MSKNGGTLTTGLLIEAAMAPTGLSSDSGKQMIFEELSQSIKSTGKAATSSLKIQQLEREYASLLEVRRNFDRKVRELPPEEQEELKKSMLKLEIRQENDAAITRNIEPLR